MSKIVEPHGGGPLKPLLIPEAQKAEELKRAESLIKVPMSSREVSDVLMMAMGAYTPIVGFMIRTIGGAPVSIWRFLMVFSGQSPSHSQRILN